VLPGEWRKRWWPRWVVVVRRGFSGPRRPLVHAPTILALRPEGRLFPYSPGGADRIGVRRSMKQSLSLLVNEVLGVHPARRPLRATDRPRRFLVTTTQPRPNRARGPPAATGGHSPARPRLLRSPGTQRGVRTVDEPRPTRGASRTDLRVAVVPSRLPRTWARARGHPGVGMARATATMRRLSAPMALMLLVAGCTASSEPTPTPTPTAEPTQTAAPTESPSPSLTPDEESALAAYLGFRNIQVEAEADPDRWRPSVPVNGGGLLDHVGC